MTTLVLLLALLAPIAAEARSTNLWGNANDATRICRPGEFYFFSDPVGTVRVCSNGSVLDLGVAAGGFCGDGLINGTDECDGTTLPGGNCSSCSPSCRCVRTATCNNGIVETSLGETCDPPNVVGVASGCSGTNVCNGTCTTCVAQSPPICDDGAVNAPEVCDRPFETGTCGGGQICNANCSACTLIGNGVIDGGEECDPGDRYSTITDGNPAPADANCPGGCRPDGTCPAASCANGIWDALRGERCDPNAAASPCPGTVTDPVTGVVSNRCTGNCVCLPECQNGELETGTGDVNLDETCEFPQSGGVDFDRSAVFARNGTCSTSTNGCATIRDAGGDRSGVGTSWDYLGATAFTLMVKFRIPTTSATQQRLFYNGGNNDTTAGYLLELSAGNRIQASLDPTSAAGGLVTMTGTTPLVANTGYTAFLRKNAAGTGVTLYLSNPTTGLVALEDSDTVGSFTNAANQRVSLGGSGLGAGPFEGTLEDVAIWDRELAEADMNALVNAEVPLTSPQISLYLDFSEAIGATAVTSKAGIGGVSFNLCDGLDSDGGGACSGGAACTVNCTGTVVLADSPWSTGNTSTENCGPVCGCNVGGETCNPSSCRCQASGASTRTFFVSSTGNNNNYPCTTSGAPCRDTNFVLDRSRAQIGDRVRLMNNTDAQPHSNIRLVCDTGTTPGGCGGGVGANAICGTEQSPITIECENERQCAFIGDGSTNAVSFQGCDRYRLIGLAARNNNNLTSKNATEHTYLFNYNTNFYLEALLGDKSNQCSNCHVYAFENSTDFDVVDSECQRNNRHCFRRAKTRRIKIRRSYANNGGVNTAADPNCRTGGNPQPGGPDHGQFTNYPANESVDLNNLAEGNQGWASQWNGGPGLGGIRGTSDNRVFGSIYAGVYTCLKNYSRPSDCRGNNGNVVQHMVCVRPQTSFGIQDAISQNTIYDRLTLWQSIASSLFSVRDPATGTCGSGSSDPSQLSCPAFITAVGSNPSFTLSNSIVSNGSGTEVQVDACQGAAVRNGVLNNVRADTYGGLASGCTPGGGGDDLDCTNARSGAGEIPTNLGDTGVGRCVTVVRCSVNADCGTTGGVCTGGICDTGADARCLRDESGNRLTGASNGLWWQTGDTTYPWNGAVMTGGGLITTTAACNATPPAGPVQGCRGGFKYCRAIRAGWNDGTLTGGTHCRNFALRWLNQPPENGTGCDASMVACP